MDAWEIQEMGSAIQLTLRSAGEAGTIEPGWLPCTGQREVSHIRLAFPGLSGILFLQKLVIKTRAEDDFPIWRWLPCQPGDGIRFHGPSGWLLGESLVCLLGPTDNALTVHLAEPLPGPFVLGVSLRLDQTASDMVRSVLAYCGTHLAPAARKAQGRLLEDCQKMLLELRRAERELLELRLSKAFRFMHWLRRAKTRVVTGFHQTRRFLTRLLWTEPYRSA